MTTILRRGDRGDDVRELQRALQSHGFDIVADGIFGRGTKTALEAFQREAGLVDDGIAGTNTLDALALSNGAGRAARPDGGGEDGANVPTIVFEREETELEPANRERVREYVERLERAVGQAVDASQRALHQFSTTMSFASASEGEADLLGAFASSVFEFAVDSAVSAAGKFVPGVELARAAVGEMIEELDRAGRASVEADIATWIRSQQRAIDAAARSFGADDVEEQLTLALLEADDPRTAFDDMVEASERLREDVVPPLADLEIVLYERWINAHFRRFTDDGGGCIEFRYEFEPGEFLFESCTVETPGGTKVGDALNELFSSDDVTVAKRPIDLRVRKRAWFRVENLVGGRSWSSGWLDARNQIIHQPIHEHAQVAIRDVAWRMTPRFRR